MKSAIKKDYNPTPDEIKSLNSFFLVRYISNDPNTIYIANALNCNTNIPIDAQYKLVRNSTLDRVAFINYPKKEKVLDGKSLKIIMYHFKVNETIAIEYVKTMGKEETKKVLDMYKNIKDIDALFTSI